MQKEIRQTVIGRFNFQEMGPKLSRLDSHGLLFYGISLYFSIIYTPSHLMGEIVVLHIENLISD